MNNSDFRSLLLSKSSQPSTSSTSPPQRTSRPLGQRNTFLPRTVRPSSKPSYTLKASSPSETTSERPAKKLKTLDLGKGYTNRALERLNADSEDVRDEKERRIHALARQVVEGELEEEEFERLREEIAGGDVESTHLVRGLDRKLLERVRRGEDVTDGAKEGNSDEEGGVKGEDEEFEEVEAREIQTKEREKVEKKGELNRAQAQSGAKKSRNEILAELKAQRAKEAQERLQSRPDLGDKFRKIEERKEKPRTIIDSKGREVIITRDENGKVKKKVRKVQPDKLIEEANKSVKFLDEDVVMPKLKEAPPAPEEEDVMENMFDDVQDDYDPLAGLGEDDDDNSSSNSDDDADEGEIDEPEVDVPAVTEKEKSAPQSTTTGEEATTTKPRNYFSSSRKESEGENTAQEVNPFKDPAFLSAVSRAGNMAKFKMQLGDGENGAEQNSEDKQSEDEDEETRLERLEKEARLTKKREMLMASMGRDDEDLDMGFGGGRFDEDDGDDDGKIKLSEWGMDEDDKGRGVGKGKEKKKRSRGKRRGDKDSAQDVLEVMRRRQEK
ncbi:putative meiotic chromosome segregation protein [Elsinoe fawcettii]|nr:putative meiotic chromosome segregation protein [Elsinoe fawcettii]